MNVRRRLISWLTAKPQSSGATKAPSLQKGDVNATCSGSHGASSQEDSPSAGDPLVGLTDAALRGWFQPKTGELFRGFPVGVDDVVADVGCGDGSNAAFCARTGASVILVDIDSASIEKATARVHPIGDAYVKSFVSDCAPLPLADGSVSRVVCTEVLEHVDDPKTVMAELVRIGRPGALYLLSCPHPSSETLQKELAPPEYFQKPNHIRIFEVEEFVELARGSGLEILETDTYGFFWSIWWGLFWKTESSLGDVSHPLMHAWEKFWRQLLDLPGGVDVKHALDNLLPKSQLIIARKP